MTVNACNHFCNEVGTTIDRMRDEYEMTYAELVGCLHILAAGLVAESMDIADDDDQEE